MRLGMLLVASAALVTCVGQANAARYYEFIVHGGGHLPLYSSIGQVGYGVDDTIDAIFDSSPAGQYVYLANGFGENGTTYSIVLQFYADGTRINLSSLQQPGGPVFSFAIRLADIPVGPSLQPVATSNLYFGYYYKVDTRYGTTYNTDSGSLISVTARTSDVAPATFGASQRLFLTLLPEPMSWATMILGIGAVGCAVRRRPNRKQLTA